MPQSAIVIKEPKVAELVHDAPLPKLRDDYIIFKTTAVALNPADWKHIDFMADPGAKPGGDYAGIVTEVGKAVTKQFKKGDRVCGFVHGSNAVNHDDGTMAEYATAKGDIQLKIPDFMSDEEAACFGVASITIGQGMYQAMNMAPPTNPLKTKEPFLVYGGSSAMGLTAIQFGKLSGYEVTTTCSPRNFDLVKKMGASHVFDYNSPTCAKDIRAATNDNLAYIYDTVTNQTTADICSAAMGSNGGQYSCVLPPGKVERKDIKAVYKLGYTVIGEPFKMGKTEIPVVPGDFEASREWIKTFQKLLDEGKIKGFPIKRDGGLSKILDGVQELRSGNVSGGKLVYKI